MRVMGLTVADPWLPNRLLRVAMPAGRRNPDRSRMGFLSGNLTRQPGDFTIAAHNIMGFLDLFFGRTGSNWVELKHLHLSCKALIVNQLHIFAG
jgi:hypothetical protein